MQRSEDYKLRKGLRNRRNQGETDHIFIRGGKILHRQLRALQFKGVQGPQVQGTLSKTGTRNVQGKRHKHPHVNSSITDELKILTSNVDVRPRTVRGEK